MHKPHWRRIWLFLIGLNVVCLACVAFLVGGNPLASRKWKPRLVVLVALDTLRADHLGCYGYVRDTSPFIDTLAREGVVFENAFSQANHTLASFASLFTGQYLRDVPDTFRIPQRFPTLASVLQANGVRTLASVAGGHLNHGFGFDRGFDAYEDKRNFVSLFHTEPYALEWLKELAADSRPAFLFLHGYDIHTPYHKPLGFEGMYDAGYNGIGRFISQSPVAETHIWNFEFFAGFGVADLADTHARYEARMPSIHLYGRDRRHICAAYDGAISYADTYVGILMNRIRVLGLADTTMVVLIGDHGEQLLEKGFLGHGWDFDDRELHVPLIMWGPGGLPAGLRVHQVVELVDLFPTLCDFLRCRPPPDLAGHSLRDAALGADAPGEGLAVCFQGTTWTIRSARFRLILASPRQASYPIMDGLYTADDTAARINLISQPQLQGTIAELRSRLGHRLEWAVR